MPFEHGRYKPLSQTLFKGVYRHLLDTRIWTGQNFPYYADGTIVTVIDLSPAMLGQAHWRKEKLTSLVDLTQMHVTALGFADASFDAIVSTFLFCVLDDQYQQPTIEELHRVCKPGGTIHILEYSILKIPLRRFIMNLWAQWVRYACVAAFDRNTE